MTETPRDNDEALADQVTQWFGRDERMTSYEVINALQDLSNRRVVAQQKLDRLREQTEKLRRDNKEAFEGLADALDLLQEIADTVGYEHDHHDDLVGWQQGLVEAVRLRDDVAWQTASHMSRRELDELQQKFDEARNELLQLKKMERENGREEARRENRALREQVERLQTHRRALVHAIETIALGYQVQREAK